MMRKEVQSSKIASIGYDNNSHALEIEFHTGSIYLYADIPQDIYTQLMESHSHGRFNAKYIKDNYFFRKMR
ncbi:MAG: KTSC domain-containing protein [Bacteroidota bacterium]